MKSGRVISIEGCLGIGKSFLAAQLSALTRFPVILEGEEGVLPDSIFEAFKDPNRIDELSSFFTDRCHQALVAARQTASAGVSCFIDVGPLTQEAYLRYDGRNHNQDVMGYIASVRQNLPDASVLLVADEAYIRAAVARRGRPLEQSEKTIQRALAVQEHCRQLATRYGAIICQRQDQDFRRASDLRHIQELIQDKLTPKNSHH